MFNNTNNFLNRNNVFNSDNIIEFPDNDSLVENLKTCEEIKPVLELFKKNGFFHHQPKEIKQFSISYIEKNGIFQKLIKSIEDIENYDKWVKNPLANIPKQIKKLIKNGVNINASDSENKHCLDYVFTQDLFVKLWENGARFPSERYTHLQAIEEVCKKIDSFPYFDKHASNKDQVLAIKAQLIEILKQTIETFSVEIPLIRSCQLIKLTQPSPWNKSPIERMMKFHPKTTMDCLLKISKKFPEEMINFGMELKRLEPELFIQIFGSDEAAFDPIIIEALLLSPKINSEDLYYGELKDCLLKMMKKSPAIQERVAATGNIISAYYVVKCLRAKRLDDLITLFSEVHYLNITFDFPILAELSQKIEHLEKREKKSIWSCIRITNPYSDNKDPIPVLESIGLQIDWENDSEHLLHNYSPFAITAFEEACMRDENLADLESAYFGDQAGNLLEFYCLNPKMHAEVPIFSLLSQLEKVCAFSPSFPIFTEDQESNDPLESIVYAILKIHNYQTMKASYFLDQSFLEFAQKIIDTDEKLKLKYKEIEAEEKWDIKIDEKDQQKYHERILQCKEEAKQNDIISFLNYLTSFWKEQIPSQACTLIPMQPLASLTLSAFLKSIEMKNFRCIKIKSFFNHLEPNERFAISQYLVENPLILNKILKSEMKLKKINIAHGGCSKATYAKFIHALMPGMDDLSLDSHPSPIPESGLIASLKEKITPKPIQQIKIDEGAEISVLNRTILVKNEGKIEAFKFLKKGENYDHFSQENSATLAFSESGIFKSTFHKPIGVYLLNELPDAFEAYAENLGKGPYYIYHYLAPSERQFVYLQKASAYQEARETCLYDATTMIFQGIAPELGELFHSYSTQRKYILLIDLSIKLMKELDPYSHFQAEGGAGRLDQAFLKILWSNMRATGLTDLRDVHIMGEKNLSHFTKEFSALREADNNSLTIKIFEKMMFLSNILLVDMLILALKHLEENTMDWENEEFIDSFSGEIQEGFALVMSTYLKKELSECKNFCKECGINWVQAAKQIAFWSDASPKGYPTWLKDERIPDGIYDSGVAVNVKSYGNVWGASGQTNNISDDFILQTENQQDIGFFNGPLGLTEFEKSMYLLYFIVTAPQSL